MSCRQHLWLLPKWYCTRPVAPTWSGTGGESSWHHSEMSGFCSLRGGVNLRLHVSCGMTVHSCTGFRLGASLVPYWHTLKVNNQLKVNKQLTSSKCHTGTPSAG